jgi:hypothetical protein
MIRLRWATVLSASSPHPGLTELDVEVAGARARAIAYDDLTGPIAEGARVLLNTTAVELDLGTGGVHLVVAVEGRDVEIGGEGHAMKMRYSPLQTAVSAVEDTDTAAIDASESLGGMPVVAAGLHSAVAPAAIGARTHAPKSRIAYVMTDGAALPAAFSHTIPALRAAGLLDVVITSGQAFGGDLEAVNLYSALVAAKGVAGADIAIVAMGPGNLGTGTRLGFASIEVAAVINAVAALAGRPIVVPRISFADERPRHHGLSHHTLTALQLALAPVEIALPQFQDSSLESIHTALKEAGSHTVVDVELGPAEDALRASPVPLRSMGRTYDDDPDFFRAAAAAGVLAARALTADA